MPKTREKEKSRCPDLRREGIDPSSMATEFVAKMDMLCLSARTALLPSENLHPSDSIH